MGLASRAQRVLLSRLRAAVVFARLPRKLAFSLDRHFRRTLGVIDSVTSCQYRCGRCGSWPPGLRFSPSPTFLPPSLSLPRRLSVAVADSLTHPQPFPDLGGTRLASFSCFSAQPQAPVSGRGPRARGSAAEERKDKTTLGSTAGSLGSPPPWQ